MPLGASCRCGHYIIDEVCSCADHKELMLYCKLHKIWYPEDDVTCPQCEWEAEEQYERYNM